MTRGNIILLAGTGESTNIVFNALKNEFTIIKVIIEDPIGKSKFILNRIKKLGVVHVFGQILFQAIIVPYLRIISRERSKDIFKIYHLDDSPIPESIISRVPSVNSPTCKQLLKELKPDLIVVNGTRIISKEVLDSINCTFINTHAGVTPQYRGVHGAYWALVQRDKEHCGVTVHIVDKGIDTGGILYQGIINQIKQDNFATYPLLQLGVGIPLLKKAITDGLEGKLKTVQSTQQSKLWYHPTIWQYIIYRIERGIK